MKISLSQKSQDHQDRIKEITDIIVKIGGNRIAFVILFGSFARGDWVRDSYVEDGIFYSYASDYDFLIITTGKKQENGISSFDLERKIKKEIEDRSVIRHSHNPHFVIEPIDYVNSELEKSRYFFSDIKKEGILLYDSKEFELSPPRELSSEERRQIAKEDYGQWYNSGKEFLRITQLCFSENMLNKAAFQLHQATESFFNCTLLVLTGYKPKTHDLEELNKFCSAQLNDFLTIFPIATKEQKDCFKLLQKAYIEARYNKNYKITKEQLDYLIVRVERLREIVEKVCEEKIKY